MTWAKGVRVSLITAFFLSFFSLFFTIGWDSNWCVLEGEYSLTLVYCFYNQDSPETSWRALFSEQTQSLAPRFSLTCTDRFPPLFRFPFGLTRRVSSPLGCKFASPGVWVSSLLVWCGSLLPRNMSSLWSDLSVWSRKGGTFPSDHVCLTRKCEFPLLLDPMWEFPSVWPRSRSSFPSAWPWSKSSFPSVWPRSESSFPAVWPRNESSFPSVSPMSESSFPSVSPRSKSSLPSDQVFLTHKCQFPLCLTRCESPLPSDSRTSVPSLLTECECEIPSIWPRGVSSLRSDLGARAVPPTRFSPKVN